MTDRNQIDINKVVGVNTDTGEIYGVDYVFKSTLHGNPFNGATGSVMRLVSQAEYSDRQDSDAIEDYYDDAWRSAVAHSDEKRGLAEYVKDVTAGVDVDEMLFDESHGFSDQVRDLIGIDEEEFPIVDYSGGGRVFHQEDIDNMDAIFDLEAFNLIVEHEGLKMPDGIDDRLVNDDEDRKVLRENMGL